MKKNLISFLLLNLVTVCSFAQTGGYKFYAPLGSVKTAGFYNIESTPELSARVKTDYSDLRIVNSEGKWIPHILHVAADEYSNTPVIETSKFSIIENSGIATVIIIEAGRKMNSDIGLLIANTAAERFCTLSGSNDKQNWFVIHDSIILNPTASLNGTENIFTISFPPNNYPFYKIVIHNKNKDPFNIRGVFQHNTVAGDTNPLYKVIENPGTSIQQKDSGKISYIKITQQLPYQFDHISLQLSGVKYYSRRVDLYVPYDEKNSYGKPGRLLQSFSVSNNSSLQFRVPVTKALQFYLLIYNEDNLPLTVQQVKTNCSGHYITAYLEPGNAYRLIMDNEAANKPDYDLVKLNSKLPDSISFLQFGTIAAFPADNTETVVPENNNWLLWPAIAVALLILIFFTYRMLKEVDKRKKHDSL